MQNDDKKTLPSISLKKVFVLAGYNIPVLSMPLLITQALSGLFGSVLARDEDIWVRKAVLTKMKSNYIDKGVLAIMADDSDPAICALVLIIPTTIKYRHTV